MVSTTPKQSGEQIACDSNRMRSQSKHSDNGFNAFLNKVITNIGSARLAMMDQHAQTFLEVPANARSRIQTTTLNNPRSTSASANWT